jgi:uncharacterized protein (DUF433 family)
MPLKPKIKASDAANDIRAGMTDSEMMEKYGLSAKGLHSLFLKLLEVRAVTQSELNRRRANYHDTTIIGQMDPGSLAADVRSGMSDSELMTKHGLSSEGLRRALQELIDAKTISPEDLYSASSSVHDTVFVENRREVTRYHLAIEVIVYELIHPETKGTLVNVADKGVAITGIEANIGEIKTFIIPAVDFIRVSPMRFEAECKWAGRDSVTGEWNCGFEITNISEASWENLRTLIQAASLFS